MGHYCFYSVLVSVNSVLQFLRWSPDDSRRMLDVCLSHLLFLFFFPVTSGTVLWFLLIHQLSFKQGHFVLPPLEFSTLKSCFSSKTNLFWSQVVPFFIYRRSPQISLRFGIPKYCFLSRNVFHRVVWYSSNFSDQLPSFWSRIFSSFNDFHLLS